MSSKDFQVINKLGEGAYSSVFRVKRKSDGKDYAMKKVRMGKLSEKEKENAVNEVRILASIDHPNIVGYYEAFYEEGSQSLCIIMEYAQGGDLLNKIIQLKKKGAKFQEHEIWKIFNDMVMGLKTLHDMKICHRDLKCANVFLTTKGHAKLGDLNVSKIAKKGLMYTQTGTPYYASPEVWKDKPYDDKSDIWSLGCVLYEMATYNPPFKALDMKGLFRKITQGIYPHLPVNYSNNLSEMVASLLKQNPSIRPTCDQILKNTQLNIKLTETLAGVNAQMAAGQLIGTIKLPKNLQILSSRLPKPKYDQIKSYDSARNHQSERGKRPEPPIQPIREIATPKDKTKNRLLSPIVENIIPISTPISRDGVQPIPKPHRPYDPYKPNPRIYNGIYMKENYHSGRRDVHLPDVPTSARGPGGRQQHGMYKVASDKSLELKNKLLQKNLEERRNESYKRLIGVGQSQVQKPPSREKIQHALDAMMNPGGNAVVRNGKVYMRQGTEEGKYKYNYFESRIGGNNNNNQNANAPTHNHNLPPRHNQHQHHNQQHIGVAKYEKPPQPINHYQVGRGTPSHNYNNREQLSERGVSRELCNAGIMNMKNRYDRMSANGAPRNLHMYYEKNIPPRQQPVPVNQPVKGYVPSWWG